MCNKICAISRCRAAPASTACARGRSCGAGTRGFPGPRGSQCSGEGCRGWDGSGSAGTEPDIPRAQPLMALASGLRRLTRL